LQYLYLSIELQYLYLSTTFVEEHQLILVIYRTIIK